MAKDIRGDFRKEMISQIKECGQELLNNAEHILPEDLDAAISEIHLDISLGMNDRPAPVIRVEVSVLPKTFIDRVRKEGFYGSTT